MDALEAIYAAILENQGYWVKQNYKVRLVKEDKVAIGRQSHPDTYELDIIAFKPSEDKLLIVECKSYLDSGGVWSVCFVPGHKYNKRYKMFTNDVLREIVYRRIVEQLTAQGLLSHGEPPTVALGLVAGKIWKNDDEKLQALFDENGWFLVPPSQVKAELAALIDSSYVNDPVVMAAKILLRAK